MKIKLASGNWKKMYTLGNHSVNSFVVYVGGLYSGFITARVTVTSHYVQVVIANFLKLPHMTPVWPK